MVDFSQVKFCASESRVLKVTSKATKTNAAMMRCFMFPFLLPGHSGWLNPFNLRKVFDFRNHFFYYLVRRITALRTLGKDARLTKPFLLVVRRSEMPQRSRFVFFLATSCSFTAAVKCKNCTGGKIRRSSLCCVRFRERKLLKTWC